MARKKVQRKTAGASKLDPTRRRILSTIFRLSARPSAGIDAQDYRAKHGEQWDTLDELERQRYLVRDSSRARYVVGLTALPEIGAKSAKKLLSSAERVFAELRKRYRRNSRSKVLLTDLARTTGVAVEDVKEIAAYMAEASVIAGHAADTDSPEAYVMPAERIVSPKYRRFRDVIAETRSILDTHERGRFRSFVASDFSVLSPEAAPRRTRRGNHVAWYRELKRGIRAMMEEVEAAIGVGARGLAAMGLRAVFDMSCNDVLGDIGGFAQKLDSLEEFDLITRNQKRMLENGLELGHAAAHRGHIPTERQVKVLREIMEHLLKQIYVLGPASEQLRKKIPPRRRTVSTSR